MTRQLTDLIYRFFDVIYKNNFAIYKWIYFNYKHIIDRHEIEIMKKVVKPGMVVVDVGANIGFYTLLMSDLVGETGVVYAFEPEINNYNHLKRLCLGRKNIIVNRFVVGEKSGVANLFVSDNLNVDHLVYNDGGKRRMVRVARVSLDDYFNVGNKIDFVKIDTQGYEHQVLRGMMRLVKKNRRIAIMSEFSAFDLSLAKVNPKEHIELIKELGLKIYILDKKLGNKDEGELLKKNSNRAIYYNLLCTKGGHNINF